MEEQTKDLCQIWATMDGNKGDLVSRSELYSAWTIPGICSRTLNASEQEVSFVEIGAGLVNNLANHIADVMFPVDQPFFAIGLSPKSLWELRQETGAPDDTSEAADPVSAAMGAVREEFVFIEGYAMSKLNIPMYRTRAVEALKHTIITGNAIIRRDDDKRIVYGVKDMCVSRMYDGTIFELIIRDVMKTAAAPKHIRERIQASGKGHQYPDDADITLYTHWKLDGGRYHQRQAYDEWELEDSKKSFSMIDSPFVDIVWSLASGEHYGRGLVEENRRLFNSLDKCTEAITDVTGIACDIKILVNPASSLNVEQLNKSQRGSYHSGKEGDLVAQTGVKLQDYQILVDRIERLERRLSQIFLMSSGGVRDAERVTAEEIRQYANELERAFGGLYSRLSLTWQMSEAEWALKNIAPDIDLDLMEIKVVTGMESLSREGQLNNFRLAMADLALVAGIPESLQEVLNPRKLADYIFTQRRINPKEFAYTVQQLKQMQEVKQQREQQMQEAAMGQQIAQNAGKE